MPDLFDLLYREYCLARLAEMRKQTVKMFGKNQLQDGVAKKFETLIVEMMALRFMTQARMRQRFSQKQ